MSILGILYFLENDSMPNLVKVGYTTTCLNARIKQLNTTGVPSPFKVIAAFSVKNVKRCESEVHHTIKQYRVSKKREFFNGNAGFLIKESFEVINKYLQSGCDIDVEASYKSYEPDVDDIYFMFYLLHDAYEKNRPFYSHQLVEHHSSYSVLTLEIKLMNLEKSGFVSRVNSLNEGRGLWQITPKGVQYMINGNHHDPDLLS